MTTANGNTNGSRFKTRRVITGHDKNGHSYIISDAECEASVSFLHPDLIITDAWRVRNLPADNETFVDPCSKVELEPARTGNVVRIVRFPPDSDYLHASDDSLGFAEIGEVGAALQASEKVEGRPLMHKTSTLDYVIIISGQIYVVMDEGETLLNQGDVLIQRGTNHAWSNRSTQPCLMAVVLNGAASPNGAQ